uniref:Uncharacterized protein n=1 Tax=Rhipicephalus pulchellus TaxID=72859 RepID=L7M1Z1_RHIPC
MAILCLPSILLTSSSSRSLSLPNALLYYTTNNYTMFFLSLFTFLFITFFFSQSFYFSLVHFVFFCICFTIFIFPSYSTSLLFPIFLLYCTIHGYAMLSFSRFFFLTFFLSLALCFFLSLYASISFSFSFFFLAFFFFLSFSRAQKQQNHIVLISDCSASAPGEPRSNDTHLRNMFAFGLELISRSDPASSKNLFLFCTFMLLLLFAFFFLLSFLRHVAK